MSIGTLEIRHALPEDARGIAEVHDSAWRNAYRGIIPGLELEKMIRRRGSHWWATAIGRRIGIVVLSCAGIVAGYATFGRNRAPELPFAGEIYELYLQPEYQGLGFGTRLFTAVRAELSRRNVDSLVVWALADNDRACNFYQALGGKPVDLSVETFGSVHVSKLAFGWNPQDPPGA